MKRTVVVLAVVLGAESACGAAMAQSYPQRNITLVSATAPGGPGDAAARVIAERMSAILGQQMIVENVAGAGGMLGTTRVARAEPDGYTLLVHQTGIAITPLLMSGPTVDVARELTAVGLVNTSYLILAGRKSLPANTLPELVAWMKQPGQSVRFAHPGTGTLGHLSLLIFARSTGTKPDAVPYRGIGPALNDMLGEHVDLAWPAVVTAGPQIQAGKIKGYVIGGPKRTPLAPDVPSATEAGMPELDMPFWHALLAPAATPRPVIEKLNGALGQALADPAVIKAYADTGVEAFPANMRSPEVAQAFVASEIARWKGVVESSGIKP